MEEEEFEGFTRRDAEEKKNLTDEQMLQVLREHQDLMNIFEAYRQGIITDEDLRRLIADKIERETPKE